MDENDYYSDSFESKYSDDEPNELSGSENDTLIKNDVENNSVICNKSQVPTALSIVTELCSTMSRRTSRISTDLETALSSAYASDFNTFESTESVLRFSRHYTDKGTKSSLEIDVPSQSDRTYASPFESSTDVSETGSLEDDEDGQSVIANSVKESLVLLELPEERLCVADNISTRSSGENDRKLRNVMTADAVRTTNVDEEINISLDRVADTAERERTITEAATRRFIDAKLRLLQQKSNVNTTNALELPSNQQQPQLVGRLNATERLEFCRKKLDHIQRTAGLTSEGIGQPTVDAAYTYRPCKYQCQVPPSLVSRVRLQSVLQRLQRTDFHEPKKCDRCSIELGRLAEAEFLKSRLAAVNEKLTSECIDNYIHTSTEALTAFGEILRTLSIRRDQPDVVMEHLLAPLHKASRNHDPSSS